jgi:hypothetical protein
MTTTERALARGTAASARQKSTPTSDGNPQFLDTNSPPAAAKHKGGPVPGTPSPMRTRLSAELHDHARRLYETTAQYASHIALDCDVDESVIRRMAEREGWVRFVAPPRDLPPVAKLLAQVEDLEKAARAPQGDGESVEQDATHNIARFTQVVMAHLDEFEAVRRAGKLIARQHLPTARAISILTEAFNKLQRLRAAQPGQIHDDISDMPADLPADLDAYRLELTRRIETFLASRPDVGADREPAAAPAAAVE